MRAELGNDGRGFEVALQPPAGISITVLLGSPRCGVPRRPAITWRATCRPCSGYW